MTDKNQNDRSSVFRNSEPVCINASRIYDSCADKDCAENIPVFFTQPVQQKIDNASSIRLVGTDIITAYINSEPVPFHKGFYTVEITFFFEITLDIFSVPNMRPDTVCGLSIFIKKVVLYGGEGNVKVFRSDTECKASSDIQQSLPKASVQTAAPIPLDARLVKCPPMCIPCCRIPDFICTRYGGSFVTNDRPNTVTVTIGLFTIVQIERYAQMIIPSYSFCLPDRDCSPTSSNPCEMFDKLEFPTEAFFPQDISPICDENQRSR